MINKIHLGDCLEIMKEIENNSIDMILCDLPYGTTSCKWDIIIPFEPLWKQYKRIIKNDGAIVLTSTQPFTSQLINSNQSMFKYEYIWVKNKPFGFIHAKNAPLKRHENILVFSKGKIKHKGQPERMRYFPQGLKPYNKKVRGRRKDRLGGGGHRLERPSLKESYIREFTNYPDTVLYYNVPSNSYHSTQKPVLLFEFLIKTYTKENDVILDNCMGSGTTAVAALNTGRRFIGIEKDEDWLKICYERIKNRCPSI